MNVIEEINDTPAPNPNNIDTINNSFNDVANAFNELWLFTQYDMPDEIINDGYAELIRNLNALTRITQDRFTLHVRNTERLAREARGRARRARLATVVVVQPAPAIIEPEPEVVLVPVQPARRVAHIVQKPKRTVRALKHSDLTMTLPDDCSICMNKYTKSGSVETSCGHTFCKECYDAHEKTALAKPGNNATVACPLCRCVNPSITEFRSRKTPVRRPRAEEPVALAPVLIEEAIVA
jgi:hypothetical protein